MNCDRRPWRIWAAWILAALLCSCARATPHADRPGAFSIYLVTDPVSTQEAMELDLAELELAEAPILSADDIHAYSWQTHEIELTESARQRIAALEVPVAGVPFVACVGDERVYRGAFWVSWSSISFQGIVIDAMYAAMEDHPIRIQLGYPESPELFEGEDRRSDPRIRQSLRQAGKLR